MKVDIEYLEQYTHAFTVPPVPTQFLRETRPRWWQGWFSNRPLHSTWEVLSPTGWVPIREGDWACKIEIWWYVLPELAGIALAERKS